MTKLNRLSYAAVNSVGVFLVRRKFAFEGTLVPSSGYKNKVYDLLNGWLKDETWSRQARPGGDTQ